MFNYNSFPDAKALADFSAKSLAPLARLAEMSAASFEKIARFQVEAAVDLTNHSAARLQATVQAAGNPYQFTARHAELTNDFVNSRNQKWQDYVKFTADLQSDVSKWADDTKNQVAAQFAPLARQAA